MHSIMFSISKWLNCWPNTIIIIITKIDSIKYIEMPLNLLIVVASCLDATIKVWKKKITVSRQGT